MEIADPRTMHPRELVRSLMRGNKAAQKLGYHAAAAVHAVAKIQPELKWEDGAYDELLAYAEGFANGMQEDANKTLPCP